jgi:hypothetical protein
MREFSAHVTCYEQYQAIHPASSRRFIKLLLYPTVTVAQLLSYDVALNFHWSNVITFLHLSFQGVLLLTVHTCTSTTMCELNARPNNTISQIVNETAKLKTKKGRGAKSDRNATQSQARR